MGLYVVFIIYLIDMKIVMPAVQLWEQKNAIEHTARCARICYRSISKSPEHDIKLINSLLSSKHFSMFRHWSIYAIVKNTIRNKDILTYYSTNPYIDYTIFRDKIFIATNKNFMLDIERNFATNFDNDLYNLIVENEVTIDEFQQEEVGYNLMRYTFCVTTQISTSREFNRVSPNNISEQSTRYVYDDGTLCKPHWITNERVDEYTKKGFCDTSPTVTYYLNKCQNDFNSYKYLIDCYKLNKQDARGVLPLDTATICAYTYSIKEWKHIINLRYYGITGVPHPNAKIIAGMIKDKLNELGYEI